MPAGSTQQPPIGLCRRQGRASRAQLLATSSCGVWLGPPALQMRLWGARMQLRKRVLAAPRWAQKSLVSACGGRSLRRRLRRACTSATVSLGPLHYKAGCGGLAYSPEMRPRGAEMGPEIARERLRRAGPPAAPAAGLHLSHCLARAPALRSGCGGLACSPEMRPAARRWAQKSLVSGGGPFGS